MDRVKAIKVLKPLVDSYVDYANISMKEEDDNIVEALEMAIEALDVPDTNVGDMISRRQAIEALRECQTYLFDSKDPDKKIELRSAEQAIDDLPTVQPDHVADIGKKVSISCGRENDVIFREAAIDALARMMPRSYTPDGSHPADEEIFRVQEVFADCIEALEILPFAQPEIIRCKDCKYCDRGIDEDGNPFLKCLGWVYGGTHEEDFCSHAERRTE